MKKIVALLVVLLAMVITTAAASPLSPAAQYCANAGILQGRLDDYATRAEVATVLYRAIGEPEEVANYDGSLVYHDVKWYDMTTDVWYAEPFRFLAAHTAKSYWQPEILGNSYAVHPCEYATKGWARMMFNYVIEQTIMDNGDYNCITRSELCEMVYHFAQYGGSIILHEGWENTSDPILNVKYGCRPPQEGSPILLINAR